MATNLIITEHYHAACAIAFAFNGILYEENSYITFGQRLQYENELKQLERSGFIKTKKSNDEYFIIWPNEPFELKNDSFAKTYKQTGQLPYTPPKMDVGLKPTFAETLKKIVIQKHIKEVFLAFSNKTSSILTAGAIAKFLPVETHVKITCMEVAAFNKFHILKALNTPISDVQLKNEFDCICRKKLVDWTLRENLSYAFNLVQNTEYALDQYLFCVLYLFNSKALNNKKHQINLQADIQMGPLSVTAVSEQTYTENEAERFLDENNIEAIFDSVYVSGLLTTSSLIKFYEKTPGITFSEFVGLMDSLFYKGYITNPYTEAAFLPANFNDDDCKRLIDICKEITNNTFTENHFAALKKSITKNREQRDYPILPLLYDLAALTDKEKALYKYIVNKTVHAINENIKNKYYVNIGKERYICPLPQDKSKSLKRGQKKFKATISKHSEFQLKYLSIQKLISYLSECRISNIDEILKAIIRLNKNELLLINGSEAKLHDDAEKIFKHFPIHELKKPDILTKWGKATDNDAAGSEAITKRDIHYCLVEWIPKILQMDVLDLISEHCSDTHNEKGPSPCMDSPVDTKAPAESNDSAAMGNSISDNAKKYESTNKSESTSTGTHEKKESYIPKDKEINCCCPNCNERLYENDEMVYCPACMFTLAKELTFNEGLISLSSTDIKDLITNKATGIKVAVDDKKEAHLGILCLTEDNEVHFTNRSNKTCPYCKSPLEIYSWGMACSECNFSVPFTIYGKKIDSANYKKLLSGKHTDFIEGLILQDGTTFTARMKIDRTGRLKLYRE